MSNLGDNSVISAMRSTLDSQRQLCTSGGAVSAEVRIDRLSRAIDLVFDNREAIVETLALDFGC